MRNLAEIFLINVRSLMAAHRWNTADLARRMQATPQQVSMWLTGKRHPSLETLTLFSEALDVPPSKLLTDLPKRLHIDDVNEAFGPTPFEALEIVRKSMETLTRPSIRRAVELLSSLDESEALPFVKMLEAGIRARKDPSGSQLKKDRKGSGDIR